MSYFATAANGAAGVYYDADQHLVKGELRRAVNVAHSVARPHVQQYLPRVLMVVARRAHRLAYAGRAVKRGTTPA